jgi:Subtilase family
MARRRPAARRVTRRRRAAEAPAPLFRTEPELIVIARPDAGLRVRGAMVEGAAASAPDALAALLADRGATMRPIFGATEARARSAVAALATPHPALPDLASFYKVDAPEERLAEIARGMSRLPAVMSAFVKPGAEPPVWLEAVDLAAPPLFEAPPVTPDFTPRQAYLDPAPGGIDARFAWTRAGGRGAAVQIIDIEGAWRFTHEDLLQNQGGVIGGTQSTDLAWRNHGTAVVGEFGGDDNGFGVTGICAHANVRAISIFGGTGSAGAIRQAADALGPGDIILLELHRPGPRHNFQQRQDQAGYIAIEWWPDDFAAILYATSRGVIVVEAAGNGAQNLDDAIYNTRPAGFPATWTNPFNRANPQCGAIVVGAGAPPPGTHGQNHGADRSRLGFSNFGACVDAQGWGREVTTTGGRGTNPGELQGGTDENIWYTDSFSGTSSASPIVVGALGCLQGVLRTAGRPLLTPATARDILRTTGSPQQDEPGRPSSERIGNRPDLRQAIGRLLPIKVKDVKDLQKDKEVKEGRKDTKDVKELKEKDLKELKEKDRKEFKEKDRKEFKEKDKEVKEGRKDTKDVKELKEKDLKELKEKDRKEFKEKDRKECKEKDKDFKDIREFGKLRELQAPTAGPESGLAERLAELERVVGELSHFIGAELRPDLATSALNQEADLMAQLQQDAADAKAAKDAKDAEKLRER